LKEYIVNLPEFEGPLDLLLLYVHNNNVDIRHLPIAPICEQYLSFLRAAEEIDLSLSSEWLAMASRLIYIKSCTLLPGRMLDEAPGNESLWDDVEDPKNKLILELMERERLLAIRNALPVLRIKEARNIGTYTRHAISDVENTEVTTYELGEVGIFDLLDHYRSSLLRSQTREPMEINMKFRKLSEIIRELLSRFLPKGVTRFFRKLLPERFTVNECVMTFLAILELARTDRVKLYQSDPNSELQVERIR
jgi:segregation and condensation protein A